ncbi:MAG TPA: endonuclease/exonuclease/phosphatase family protein [Anaerolineales bacterium]|nr:endonuclease/exonuclease/phosphatase family protein [Anaerolineales bacterium]
MTYNILDGGENREAYILEILQTAKPDVIILQEIFTEEFLVLLSHSLAMSYCLDGGNRKRKVALLSRLPVLAFKSYQPGFPIWRNFIEAEIEIQPGKSAWFFGVHPVANLGVLFEFWRFCEAVYVTNHVRRFSNKPCLIAGDFNAIAPGETVRTENMPNWLKWIIYLQGNRVYQYSIRRFSSAGFTDCFRLLNADTGFTLPPPDPNSRLDYIFVNNRMKKNLRKCWVVREPDQVNFASDHYPVMAEFDFAVSADDKHTSGFLNDHRDDSRFLSRD